MARKSLTPSILPSLDPKRAHTHLKKQLQALQSFKGRKYNEAEYDEQQWTQLTEGIVEKAFGSPSTASENFRSARFAGNHSFVMGRGIPPQQHQSNFQQRIAELEAFLKGAIAQLELDIPDEEIQGHYDVGQEYEFYRDVKQILALANTEVFIIDPYLSDDIFNLYADGINRSIRLRILSNNIPVTTGSVAAKYAAGGNLSLRTTAAIHDRLILIDERAWLIGQSIKDAAKKKPTYIVEQSAQHIRPPYEAIWASATVVY
jgi:hypothetical protein